jgi:hypothetical protein
VSSTIRGFNIRDLTQHGKPEIGNVVVNPGKVLPATATGNLFAVTGAVAVLGLFGVVSTVFSVTAVHITLGDTQTTTAIAAAPAAAYASTAVGGVIVPPPTLGAALPAIVTAQSATAGAGQFVLDSANITITTDATNTGAVTWVLSWAPLFPKRGAAVTAV